MFEIKGRQAVHLKSPAGAEPRILEREVLYTLRGCVVEVFIVRVTKYCSSYGNGIHIFWGKSVL